MITKACRECENWKEKQLIYFIGYIKNSSLASLWIVYGDCYAADEQIYEGIKNKIANGIKNIPNIDFAETKELGKVKKVDPLGITELRIRGMWDIQNPNKVFNYITTIDTKVNFQINCLMSKAKFNSFPEGDRMILENISLKGFIKKEVKIKDPNNPSRLIDGILIKYKK